MTPEPFSFCVDLPAGPGDAPFRVYGFDAPDRSWELEYVVCSYAPREILIETPARLLPVSCKHVWSRPRSHGWVLLDTVIPAGVPCVLVFRGVVAPMTVQILGFTYPAVPVH